jgi:flagellar hook-associated protein 2
MAKVKALVRRDVSLASLAGGMMSTISSLGTNSLSSGSSSSGLNVNQNANGAPITVGGLASGLDTNSIIQSLLAVEQAQIQILQNKQDTATQQETAFKKIEASLLALQGDTTSLGSSINGVFDLRAVTSSDESLVTAAATSAASPGVYTIQVNSLAKAQEIASQEYASPSTAITQGTVQLSVGSGPAATITIDSTNNTLQGLADAINNAAAGVTATVVNDGSGSNGQSYRLLLSANQSGASSTIHLVNNLGADGGGAAKPVFDSAYIGAAGVGTGYTGTSTPTSNSGAGNYTGTGNNTYTFTVVNGGTVGTDNGVQLSYTDSTGANTGTITLNSGDANAFKTVAQGIQIQFSAGTLVAGQTLSIGATVPTVQQAANASVSLGSGAGALTVQSATNQIDGAITGVTLNLQGASPTQTVTLTVASDTSQAEKTIQDFVSNFNDLMSYINSQVSYDPSTQTAGPLLGNQSAVSIQDNIRNIVDNVVSGINPRMSGLSSLGLTFNDQGQLDIDQARLSQALSGQTAGVSLNDVRNLFALAGTATNSGIQFITGSDKTTASATPYQVNVTQAAQQASMTATNALAASTTIDGTNNTFTIKVDGRLSGTITLASGTYSPQGLAQEVQAEINASSSLTGRQVAVGLSGNQLTISSNTFGSSSQVAIGSGTALTALGFAGGESGAGRDVAGNFVVNGVTESATGSGQFLTGASGNANTAGLEVRVTLSAAQVGSGTSANLTVTRGIAAQLGVALDSLLDPVSGRLKTIDDNFQQNINDIQKEIDQEKAFMAQKQQDLLNQFVAMETAISQLQSVSGTVSSMLSGLPTANTFVASQQPGSLPRA